MNEKKYQILAFLVGVSITSIILYLKNLPKIVMNSATDNIVTSQGAINNVGNIRQSPVKYLGEIDSPSDNFKSFSSVAYGYRAMIQILRHYYHAGYLTLRQMINHYAPESDGNNPESYINFVASYAGISPDEDASTWINNNTITKVIFAMSKIEQGNEVADNINLQSVQDGYNLA